jgi:transposase
VKAKKDYADELREIIDDHDLSRTDVSTMLGVSAHTVDSWLKPPTSKSHNRVSLQTVELLRLKLGAR